MQINMNFTISLHCLRLSEDFTAPSGFSVVTEQQNAGKSKVLNYRLLFDFYNQKNKQI